jgi:AraC-like DNA-binding protein
VDEAESQDGAAGAATRLAPLFDETDAARLSGLADALTASLEPRGSVVVGSADAIIRHWGMIPIGKLAAGAGVGARQLERRFLDEVGVTPKLLARISRFQRVFRAIERRPIGWTRVAAECGYYDSSHLVRDCREFAGEPPSRALDGAEALTLAFTRARRTDWPTDGPPVSVFSKPAP